MKTGYRKNSKAFVLIALLLLTILALSACATAPKEAPRYEFVDYKVYIDDDPPVYYGNPVIPFKLTVTVKNVGGDKKYYGLTEYLFRRDVSLVNDKGASYSNWHIDGYLGDDSGEITLGKGEKAAVTYQFETIPEDGQYVLDFSFDGTAFSIPVEVSRASAKK